MSERDHESSKDWNDSRKTFEDTLRKMADEEDPDAIVALSNMYVARAINKLAVAIGRSKA